MRDLKTQNLQTQVAADKKNATDEEISARVVSDLTRVANINKANFDEAKANRDHVDKEIRDAVSWIDWAHGRLAEIARRSAELSD